MAIVAAEVEEGPQLEALEVSTTRSCPSGLGT
jgi:hypothetical protein